MLRVDASRRVGTVLVALLLIGAVHGQAGATVGYASGCADVLAVEAVGSHEAQAPQAQLTTDVAVPSM